MDWAHYINRSAQRRYFGNWGGALRPNAEEENCKQTTCRFGNSFANNLANEFVNGLEQAMNRCSRCSQLEKIHEEKMEQYIDLVNQQSRMFRGGYVLAGREIDVTIRQAKAERDAAVELILVHGSRHAG